MDAGVWLSIGGKERERTLYMKNIIKMKSENENGTVERREIKKITRFQ